MPSVNKTPNYGLNQWAGNEYAKRQDFVDDNEIIDLALKGLEDDKVEKIAGKGLSTEDYTTAEKQKLSGVDEVKIAGGTGTAITITASDIATYRANLKLTFIASTNNGGSPTTININGLGPKPIYKPNTTTSPNIVSGKAYEVWYNQSGNCFFHKASAEGNAVAGDVLAGKTFSNDDDTGIVGSIPSKSAQTITPGTANQTIAAGQYLSGVQTILGDPDLVSANIRAGTNIFGVSGKSSVVDTDNANAVAAQILLGKTAYVNGSKLTGSIPSKAAASITPGTTSQIIAAGQYLSGDQTIAGDADLIAGNIKSGVSIFGVTGTVKTLDISLFNAMYNIINGLTVTSSYRPYNIYYNPSTGYINLLVYISSTRMDVVQYTTSGTLVSTITNFATPSSGNSFVQNPLLNMEYEDAICISEYVSYGVTKIQRRYKSGTLVGTTGELDPSGDGSFGGWRFSNGAAFVINAYGSGTIIRGALYNSSGTNIASISYGNYGWAALTSTIIINCSGIETAIFTGASSGVIVNGRVTGTGYSLTSKGETIPSIIGMYKSSIR